MAKKNGKIIAAFVLSGLAFLMGGGSLARQISKEDTKDVSSYQYTIGTVNDAGKIDKSDKSSITSDKFNAEDLVSIKVDEEANVDVFVYWYSKDGALLSSSQVEGERTNALEGAEKFRVVITPNDDEDGEVTAFEKGGYANLVTVTLKK